MKPSTVALLLIGLLANTWASPSQDGPPAAMRKTLRDSGAAPKPSTPSGPFGIGRVGYHWTDPSRPDRYSADPQARRELMVYLWYPTSKKGAEVRGTYLPGALEMDIRLPLYTFRNPV
jgi:hypothetical protein